MMGELYHVCILQVNLCVQGQTNAVSLHTANHLDYRLFFMLLDEKRWRASGVSCRCAFTKWLPSPCACSRSLANMDVFLLFA